MGGNNTIYHLEVWFSGHVQGVGFRYQTVHLAKGFDICGTVENLSDGRVYLSAEGEKAEVDAFVKELCDQMSSFIHTTEQKSEYRVREHSGFVIH